MKNPEKENKIENTEQIPDEIAEELSEVASDEDVSEGIIEELNSKKLQLEGEIALLEGELERKREETDRKAREYAEFKELFPHAEISELSPEVLAMVDSGVPISAAYALYEKRLSAKNAAAAAHNNATKQGGFGSVGRGGEEEFYTPDEVRAMTQSEVKHNYQKILRSMKNWH